MFKQVILFLVVIIILSACQSEQVINIVDEKDVEEIVSYSNQVQPIFNNSCSGSGCHINNTRSGVNLTDFSATITSSGVSYGQLIIEAGNADNSPLIDVLGQSPSNSRRMPLNASPLTSAEITLIRSWINQGAQNN